MSPTTDDALTQVERTLEGLRARQATIAARRDQLVSEKRALLDKAAEADTTRAALQAQRPALLAELRAGTVGADTALRDLTADEARLQRLGGDYRDAAALCDPGLEEVNREFQQAARAVARAVYAVAWVQHRQAAATIEECRHGFDGPVAAFLATGAALDEAHRQAFGTEIRLDVSPGHRLARALAIWSREIVPPAFRALLLRVFPADSGSLTRPLEAIAPSPSSPTGGVL